MAMTIHCDVVSAEEEIFSGRVTMVVARAPWVSSASCRATPAAGVKPGPVRLLMARPKTIFASGGFLEVQPGVVTVSPTRLRVDDLDEVAAQQPGRSRSAMANRRPVRVLVAAAQLAGRRNCACCACGRGGLIPSALLGDRPVGVEKGGSERPRTVSGDRT